MRDQLRKRRTLSEERLDLEGSVDMEERVPTERVQKYESVAVDELAGSSTHRGGEPSDEEDESDVADGELGRLNGKGRRRLRAPPAFDQGGSVVLGNAKFLLIFLLIVLGAVMIMWQSSRSYTKKNHGTLGTQQPGRQWPFDDDDDSSLSSDESVRSDDYSYPVKYDLKWMDSEWNPFNMDDKTAWDPPSLPWTPDANAGAYLMQPDVNNRIVVFVSEGDLYVTKYDVKSKSSPAAKITTTVGNVRTPRLHPDQPIVAFTATYQGRREVYLQDLRGGGATRLTFWDDPYGVPRVVGWKDAHTLIITARHTAVAMPDLRLFLITVSKDENNQHAVMDVAPVPLSQAQDAAVQTYDKGVDCYYFTRNSQTSHTLRYVGGTVEQLWAYCDGYDHAVPLTTDYKGTSKMPMLWSKSSSSKQQDYLIFASDRAEDKNGYGYTWTAGTMNLWAMKLPTPKELYAKDTFAPPLIQVTNLQCWQQGRTLQEFSIDPAKRNIVLRMGADLFEISSSALDEIFAKNDDDADASVTEPDLIAIQVVSDFHETQERLIPFNLPSHWINGDVVSLPSGQISVLLTLRGQTWMAPILHDTSLSKPYQGGGQNMPPRRYRVAPGALTGGAMRILNSINVPLHGDDPVVWARRLALILATDPLSPTAEHAFYLLPIQENAPSAFADLEHAPRPFLGGHVNGGSTKDGGLGSVRSESVSVSPCGRRVAWTDTDGNIAVMTLPLFHQQYDTTVQFTILPDTNELGEPMDGTLVDLLWSPGGRYLAITHAAQNKFNIISLADCGDPLEGSIKLGRIVQATPSRFNSMSPYWGYSRVDSELDKFADLMSKVTGESDEGEDMATTLYFLTDRDIANDVSSPWGDRAPMPHFPRRTLLYAIPLLAVGTNGVLDPNVPLGRFSGGAPMEVFAEDIQALTLKIKSLLKNKVSGKRALEETSRRLVHTMVKRGLSNDSPQLERMLKEETTSTSDSPSVAPTTEDDDSQTIPFPVDMEIDFGPKDLSFARRAYRMVNVPESNYYQILSQTEDNGSLILIDASSMVASIKIFSAATYPYDEFKAVPVATPGKRLLAWGQSTDRQFIYVAFAPEDTIKVLKNTLADVGAAVAEFAAGSVTTHVADLDMFTLSVWPRLEYRQLYNDAWRMLRDYFWDVEMHQVDWPGIHSRYLDLVDRCNKREELDDVLAQMAAELSALHVFVYGGEYSAPFEGDPKVIALHEPASLGASLERAPEWKGYKIKEIPHRDPDFNLIVGKPVYSPLSSQSLWQTGQKGLQPGDVIVGVNGESVFRVPDIGMLLRGMAGRSVRLEVLRLMSGDHNETTVAVPEPVIVVPLTTAEAADLRYTAWEYQTRELAKSLAKEAGFTVGYAHLRAMSGKDINAFAQGFFEDYNKQTLILDVRHNHGGNIDSWVTTMIQRAAWSFFGGRTRFGGGDLDWDQQGSFQGHVVVLIDEHTSSDGEGVSRSISELGLGKLIGTRTWGGGIWLASDNKLVDGGIATAPEFGVYNENFGWGMGIEQQGVDPDIEVDNDPRMNYDGKDAQLERAIAELEQWIKTEPVVIPKPPVTKPNKALPAVSCPATR
eukprot:scaffold1189_cov194-Amphora_coffeaeformis.AAC.12